MTDDGCSAARTTTNIVVRTAPCFTPLQNTHSLSSNKTWRPSAPLPPISKDWANLGSATSCGFAALRPMSTINPSFCRRQRLACHFLNLIGPRSTDGCRCHRSGSGRLVLCVSLVHRGLASVNVPSLQGSRTKWNLARAHMPMVAAYAQSLPTVESSPGAPVPRASLLGGAAPQLCSGRRADATRRLEQGVDVVTFPPYQRMTLRRASDQA